MVDMKELILTIVRLLVSQSEAVLLETEESADFLEHSLTVAEEDTGRIIGKQGRVTKAIRIITYSVRIDGPKKVRLNTFDDKQALIER